MAQRKRLNIWWNPQRCCNYRIHQRARFVNQLTLPLFSHGQSLWRGHGHVQSITNTAPKASGLCFCVALSAGWMAQTCWQTPIRQSIHCVALPTGCLKKVPKCTRSMEAVCLWCVYWYAMHVQKTRFCSLGFQAVGTNMVYTHDIPETETYIACMCVQKQTLLRFMIYTLMINTCPMYHLVTHTKHWKHVPKHVPNIPVFHCSKSPGTPRLHPSTKSPSCAMKSTWCDFFASNGRRSTPINCGMVII